MSPSFIYIALPVREDFLQNKDLVRLFVSNDADYLTQFTFKNQIYWGKKIETPLSLEAVEIAGRNVLSLVSKVYPSHQMMLSDLLLFPDPDLITLEDTKSLL